MSADRSAPWTLSWDARPDGTLVIGMAGRWQLRDGLPRAADLDSLIGEQTQTVRLVLDGTAIESWDSGLLTYLSRVAGICSRRSLPVDTSGLPEGARRLLALASAVPERSGARRTAQRDSFFAAVGKEVIAAFRGTGQMAAFLGDSLAAVMRLARGRAGFRGRDLLAITQTCGAQALPIVTLISFLVGMILAFVGSVQLEQFGAEIFVADLVGLAMAREMAGMMTAIVMAGRTGAAFAAQLGTMQVNQEIDAFKTFGIAPMDFLVLPRMLALITMVPLLTVYADLMGILGGAMVGVGVMGLSPVEYFVQTQGAIGIGDFAGGLFKAAVFGVLVAVAGCLRGIQCGRSAEAVGDAATSAVVTGIVFIILSDAVLTVVYTALGI